MYTEDKMMNSRSGEERKAPGRSTIRGSHGSLRSPFEHVSASLRSADRSLRALPPVACLPHREAVVIRERN